MRFKTTILALAILCADGQWQEVVAQTIYQNTDKFDGSTLYSTERRAVGLDGGSFFSMRYVTFELEATKPVASRERPYEIIVRTSTPEWVFISAGPSLVLKLDGGEMLPLVGGGSASAREVESGDEVTEAAVYALTPGELEKIARAKSVEFRLIGDRQAITGTWSAELIADATAFLARGPQLLGLANDAAAPTAPSANPATAGQAHAPTFGIVGLNVSSPLATTLKLASPQGFLVVKVQPGSIAERAGIVPGDVILEFDKSVILKAEDLQSELAKVKSGESLPVSVWRGAAKTVVNAKF